MKLSTLGGDSTANYESQERTYQTQLNFADCHIHESNYNRGGDNSPAEITLTNPSQNGRTSPGIVSGNFNERGALEISEMQQTNQSQYQAQKNHYNNIRAKSATSPTLTMQWSKANKENKSKHSSKDDKQYVPIDPRTAQQTIETVPLEVTPAHLSSVDPTQRASKYSLHQQSSSHFQALSIHPPNLTNVAAGSNQVQSQTPQSDPHSKEPNFRSFERRFDVISGRNEAQKRRTGDSAVSKALKNTKNLADLLSIQGLNRDVSHQRSRESMEKSDRSQGRDGATLQALIYVGGSNAQGQLGLGDRLTGQTLPTLTPLTNFNKVHNAVAKVSCGQRHAAIVTQARQLFTMGSNRQGQLGVGIVGDASRGLTQCSFPMLVDSLSQSQVVDVACGKDHTLAIVSTPFKSKSKYSVFSWGSNSNGQLGLATKNVHVAVPTQVQFEREAELEISRISAGHSHSLFMDSAGGSVYGVGSNTHGQLGGNHLPAKNGEPVQLNIEQAGEPKQKIVQVACGHRHSLLLTFSGKVYETGEVPEGFKTASGSSLPEVDIKEGAGQNNSVRDQFQSVPGLRSVLKIAAGSHSAAIDCKGFLYIWGVPGQMSWGNFPRPFRISSNKDFSNEILTMQVGDDFGLAKNRAGKVFMWGRKLIMPLEDTLYSNAESNAQSKSNYEDLMKPLALFDETSKWELKADQIAAGYDSVFVSVIPRGTGKSAQGTTNSSVNSRQVSMAQTMSVEQQQQIMSQDQFHDQQMTPKVAPQMQDLGSQGGQQNRDQKTITSSPAPNFFGEESSMQQKSLLPMINNIQYQQMSQIAQPPDLFTPKAQEFDQERVGIIHSSSNTIKLPTMFQSRAEPMLQPLEPLPYQSQFARRLFSGEKAKDRFVDPEYIEKRNSAFIATDAGTSHIMSDEKDSRMMSCEARTAEFRSVAGRHISLQSSLEIEEKRSFGNVKSTDRPYEVSDVTHQLLKQNHSSQSLSRIPNQARTLQEETIQSSFMPGHPTISTIQSPPNVSAYHGQQLTISTIQQPQPQYNPPQPQPHPQPQYNLPQQQFNYAVKPFDDQNTFKVQEQPARASSHSPHQHHQYQKTAPTVERETHSSHISPHRPQNKYHQQIVQTTLSSQNTPLHERPVHQQPPHELHMQIYEEESHQNASLQFDGANNHRKSQTLQLVEQEKSRGFQLNPVEQQEYVLSATFDGPQMRYNPHQPPRQTDPYQQTIHASYDNAAPQIHTSYDNTHIHASYDNAHIHGSYDNAPHQDWKPPSYQQMNQPRPHFQTYDVHTAPQITSVPEVIPTDVEKASSALNSTNIRMKDTHSSFTKQEHSISNNKVYRVSSQDHHKSHQSTEIDSQSKTPHGEPTPPHRLQTTPHHQQGTPTQFQDNSANSVSSRSPMGGIMRKNSYAQNHYAPPPLQPSAPPPLAPPQVVTTDSSTQHSRQYGHRSRPGKQKGTSALRIRHAHVQTNLQQQHLVHNDYASDHKQRRTSDPRSLPTSEQVSTSQLNSRSQMSSQPAFVNDPSSQAFYGDRESGPEQHNLSAQYGIRSLTSDNQENLPSNFNQYQHLQHVHQSLSYPPLQSPTSPIIQRSPGNIETKTQRQLGKLRKKYKKLKAQARMLLHENDRLRVSVEQDKLRCAADKERIRSTSQEVQRLRASENQARSQSPVGTINSAKVAATEKELMYWRSKALQSENELSRTQHEGMLTEKRTDTMLREFQSLEAEVDGLREQLVQKTDFNSQLQLQCSQMQKGENQRSHHTNELKRNLDIRAEQCEDYVKHARILQQTLEEMQIRQEQQIASLKERDYKIEELINHGKQQNELIEIREQQSGNLLGYIEQLETNNQDLLVRMDNRDYQNAQEYKERAFEALQSTSQDRLRFEEADKFKQRAFSAMNLVDQRQVVKPAQRTINYNLDDNNSRSRYTYIDRDREEQRRHRSQATVDSRVVVPHTQSTKMAFSPASQKAVCSQGSHSYSPVFQPRIQTTSPEVYMPSEIRLLNLREREHAENESMVNSIAQNLPQMLDAVHFRDHANMELFSDPITSYQGTVHPPTPQTALLGNAREMMQRLTNQKDRRSSGECRSLGSTGSASRVFASRDYQQQSDFSPRLVHMNNPRPVARGTRISNHVRGGPVGAPPVPVLTAHNWQEDASMSADDRNPRRRPHLLSVDAHDRRLNQILNSIPKRDRKDTKLDSQNRDLDNQYGVMARGRLELLGPQGQRHAVYTKDEPKLVNQLLNMRKELLPPQEEARMLITKDYLQYVKPPRPTSVTSVQCGSEEGVTVMSKSYEMHPDSKKLTSSMLSRGTRGSYQKLEAHEGRNTAETHSSAAVGFDTIQDVIRRGQKLLGDHETSYDADIPTRTKNSAAMSTSQERASITATEPATTTDPNITYTYGELHEEGFVPIPRDTQISASTKITRAMMQKGLANVSAALAGIKRDRRHNDSHVSCVEPSLLEPANQEESYYN